MTAGPLPDNPFRPGFGGLPPFLAGRDREKERLGTMLRRLLAGERDPDAVLLHGPRGNGKTVMIGWLENEAGDRVNLRQMKARSVSDQAEVATHLVASRHLVWRPLVSLSMREAMRQAARSSPLLMVMDEAHTADPAGLGVFLKAFQDSARRAPMRLVLAGTPDVQDVLSASGAGFADRMNQLPIGLLSPEAGRAAIGKPFSDHGIEADDEVVERLAAWADNYPYFLQVVGEAAWTEAENFGQLTGEAGEAAIERARVRCAEYFYTRYKELKGAGLTAFAADVARSVQAGENRIRKVEVEEIARQHCGDGWKAAVDFIVRKGFLWRPHLEPEFQAGIPSLMRYTVRRYETDPAATSKEVSRPDDPFAIPDPLKPPSL